MLIGICACFVVVTAVTVYRNSDGETLEQTMNRCAQEDSACVQELVPSYHPDATYEPGALMAGVENEVAAEYAYYYDAPESVEPCDVENITPAGTELGEDGYYVVQLRGSSEQVSGGCAA